MRTITRCEIPSFALINYFLIFGAIGKTVFISKKESLQKATKGHVFLDNFVRLRFPMCTTSLHQEKYALVTVW